MVIFDVSGQINLESTVNITSGFLTVAGQTAPSPGITIAIAGPSGATSNGLVVGAKDVLIQHIRIRGKTDPAGGRRDILFIASARVVIDHVSVSWGSASGKNMVIDGDGAANVTISNCITSEAFPYGMLVEGNTRRLSILRTLFAHNFDRNPEVASNTLVTFVNNFIYNPGEPGRPFMGLWRGQAFGEPQDGAALTSIIGNIAKAGPTSGALQLSLGGTALPGSRAYTSDNAFPGGIVYETETGFTPIGSPPFPLPNPLTILPSSDVPAYIVAHGGARPADRDAVDRRIIDDVVNSTGTTAILTEEDVGGFPALAENTRALALPANPNGDDDGDGYTNLEELLYELSACVEGRSTDLAQCRAWAVIP